MCMSWGGLVIIMVLLWPTNILTLDTFNLRGSYPIHTHTRGNYQRLEGIMCILLKKWFFLLDYKKVSKFNVESCSQACAGDTGQCPLAVTYIQCHWGSESVVESFISSEIGRLTRITCWSHHFLKSVCTVTQLSEVKNSLFLSFSLGIGYWPTPICDNANVEWSPKSDKNNVYLSPTSSISGVVKCTQQQHLCQVTDLPQWLISQHPIIHHYDATTKDIVPALCSVL